MSPYRGARNKNCASDDWDDSDLRRRYRLFEFPLQCYLEAVARNDVESIPPDNLQEIQDLCDRSHRCPTSCRSLRFLMSRMALAKCVKEVRYLRETAGERLRMDRWWRPYGEAFADKLAWTRIHWLRQNPLDPMSPEWWFRDVSFPLLRLPTELRRQIYDFVLPRKGQVVLPLKYMGNQRWGEDGERVESIPNLMLTNHWIREELQAVLYRERLFGLRCNPSGFSFLQQKKWTWSLQKLYPKVSEIRHWRVSVGAGHKKGKVVTENTYPHYLQASDLKQIKVLVQKLCDYLLRARNITKLEIVADEKYNWGLGDFKKARSISSLRPTNWVLEDYENLTACGHGECADNECVWVSRASQELRTNALWGGTCQRSRLTDIEYVLQPFEQLRELSTVSVTLPRELKKDPRTVAYKHTLETLLTSDCDFDLRVTETWAWLVNAARGSLHSVGPQAIGDNNALNKMDVTKSSVTSPLELNELFTGLSEYDVRLSENALKMHHQRRRYRKNSKSEDNTFDGFEASNELLDPYETADWTGCTVEMYSFPNPIVLATLDHYVRATDLGIVSFPDSHIAEHEDFWPVGNLSHIEFACAEVEIVVNEPITCTLLVTLN